MLSFGNTTVAGYLSQTILLRSSSNMPLSIEFNRTAISDFSLPKPLLKRALISSRACAFLLSATPSSQSRTMQSALSSFIFDIFLTSSPGTYKTARRGINFELFRCCYEINIRKVFTTYFIVSKKHLNPSFHIIGLERLEHSQDDFGVS